MTDSELIEANRTDIAELRGAVKELVKEVLPAIAKVIDKRIRKIQNDVDQLKNSLSELQGMQH